MIDADERPGPGGAEQPTAQWPPTLWTLVLEAKKGDSVEAQAALSKLTEIYYRPILNYLTGVLRDRERAEEMTHAFLHHLREKNRLEKLERRENAKFRSYLKAGLFNFLRTRWRDAPREDPLDESHHEFPGAPTEPGVRLDRAIALDLHQQSMNRVEQKFDKAGNQDRLASLRPYLLGDPAEGGYGPLAGILQMTEGAVRVELFRMRRDYLDWFREQVAQTVCNDRAELEQETRYLMQLVPAALEEAGLKP